REEEPSLRTGESDGLGGDPYAGHGAEDSGPFGEPAHREPYSEHPEPLVFPGEDADDEDDLLSFGEPEGPRTVKVGAAHDAAPSWQGPPPPRGAGWGGAEPAPPQPEPVRRDRHRRRARRGRAHRPVGRQGVLRVRRRRGGPARAARALHGDAQARVPAGRSARPRRRR